MDGERGGGRDREGETWGHIAGLEEGLELADAPLEFRCALVRGTRMKNIFL